VNVTVASDPAGVPIWVDGTSNNTPVTVSWPAGSFHILAAIPESGGDGIQYAWNSWSDGGDLAHQIFPTNDSVFTASFRTQYFLAMNSTNLTVTATNLAASITNSGALSPFSGWYDAGTNLLISATPPFGDNFAGWSGIGAGSFSGTNNPVGLTITNPITETAMFTGPLTNRLRVIISGTGTVNPNYNGQGLTLGRTFTMTAKAGVGYVFSNWVGSFTTTSPALSFVMTNGLVFQANFIPSPFGAFKGTYNGLFYNTNVVAPQSSGFFTATLTDAGILSGKFLLAGRSYAFSSQLSAIGTAALLIPRPGQVSLVASLQLDMTGLNVVTGQITDGSAISELTANLGVYSRTNPAPQAGRRYTLVLPGGTYSAAEPGGDCFGTVMVDAMGNVTFSGTLADGTKISQKAILSSQGQWPFYVSLYSGGGVILGWLNFTNQPEDDISGLFNWFRLPVPMAKIYPSGFIIENEAAGSIYTFSNGVPVLDFGAGQGRLILENGRLTQTITNYISINPQNKVTTTNKMTLTIATSSGLFTGSVTDPATGRAVSISGALLQKSTNGAGFFLNGNQAGRVRIEPPRP